MSGHSHWSTIRRKKQANDAKRGKIFTKIAREIVIAVREGGGDDPETNFQLRTVLDQARDAEMPNDNIERAIKRGTGEDKSGAEIVQVMYEGYGPNGVAMMIDVVTDNRNRSVAAVRHALTRVGGSMASPGAVAWQFDRKGLINVESDIDFFELFEAAAEAGAEDVGEGEDGDPHEVYTSPADLHHVSKALRDAGVEIKDPALVMMPQNEVSLDTRDSVRILKLISEIEDLDDVRQVYSNLEMTAEAVEAYATEA